MRRVALLMLLVLLPACGGSPEGVSAPEPSSTPTDAQPSASDTAGSVEPRSSSPVKTGAPSIPPSSPAGATPSPEPGRVVGAGADALSVTRLQPTAAAEQAGLGPAGGVDGLRFTDALGTSVVLLRRRANSRNGASLLADHVVHSPSAQRRVLREVRDGVPECDVDMISEFVPGSLMVSDQDGDDIGEVSFAYQLNCAGDVTAAEQKLILLEGGKKYVLRGSAFSPYEEFVDPQPDPAPSAWPQFTYDTALVDFRRYARG